MNRRAGLATELLTPLVLLAFAVYLVVNLLLIDASSADFPGPRFVPGVVAGLMLLLIALEVAGILRRHAGGGAGRGTPAVETSAVETSAGETPGGTTSGAGAAGAGPSEDRLDDGGRGFDWPALAWTVGGFVLFIATLRLLGWVLAAALLFWCVARGFGERRGLHTPVVGLTVSSLAYIAFDMVLGLNLPSGVLGGGL